MNLQKICLLIQTVIAQVNIAELKAAFEKLNDHYHATVQAPQNHRDPRRGVDRAMVPPVEEAARVTHNEGGSQADLSSFLTYGESHIPPLVLALAHKGIENFKKDPLKSALAADDIDSGKFRQHENWISDTFGQNEDQIVAALQTAISHGNLPPLQTWTVDAIGAAYRAIAVPAAARAPEFILVSGVGISGLHASIYGQDAVVQLASQFNYLESPDNHVVPVSKYPNDRTQGPLGVVEAAAATLHRHAAVTHPTQPLPHALQNVIPAGAPYQYGYFEPKYAANQSALLEHIKANIGKLSILPQWVVNEASGTKQMHVFAAAPSYQGAVRTNIASTGGQICLEIVVAQYDAIAKLAVMRSVATGKLVRLHLTQVGQGVFNNPKEVMIEAMKRVANTVKGFNVKVYVHVFSDPDNFKRLNSANITGGLFTLKDMDRGTFLGAGQRTSITASSGALRR